jgi:hypothetical protein
MVGGLLFWQTKDSPHFWNYRRRFIVSLNADNLSPICHWTPLRRHWHHVVSLVGERPGRVVNKWWGRVVQTGIKAGSRVLVYYVNTGNSRVVDHVVVLD